MSFREARCESFVDWNNFSLNSANTPAINQNKEKKSLFNFIPCIFGSCLNNEKKKKIENDQSKIEININKSFLSDNSLKSNQKCKTRASANSQEKEIKKTKTEINMSINTNLFEEFPKNEFFILENKVYKTIAIIKDITDNELIESQDPNPINFAFNFLRNNYKDNIINHYPLDPYNLQLEIQKKLNEISYFVINNLYHSPKRNSILENKKRIFKFQSSKSCEIVKKDFNQTNDIYTGETIIYNCLKKSCYQNKFDLSVISMIFPTAKKYNIRGQSKSDFKMKKLMTNILFNSLNNSKEIILILNSEFDLKELPEIFENAFSLFKKENISTTLEIFKNKEKDKNNNIYIVRYRPNNQDILNEEIEFLLSEIINNEKCHLNEKRRSQILKLKELFKDNNKALLQICFNFNIMKNTLSKSSVEIKEKETKLFEYIILFLYETDILTRKMIETSFNDVDLSNYFKTESKKIFYDKIADKYSLKINNPHINLNLKNKIKDIIEVEGENEEFISPQNKIPQGPGPESSFMFSSYSGKLLTTSSQQYDFDDKTKDSNQNKFNDMSPIKENQNEITNEDPEF